MIQGVVTFEDKGGAFHVYLPKNGLPYQVIERITASKERAHILPKFEPGDYAAAYVAYVNASRGAVRMLPTGDWKAVTPPETKFRYVVSVSLDVMNIECVSIHFDEATDKWYEKTLFSGTADQFQAWAAKEKEGQS